MRLAAAYRRQHLQIHADRFLSGRAGRYFEKPRLQPEPTELDSFDRRYRSGEGIVCRTDGAAVGGAVRAVSRLAAGGDAGAFGSVRADGLHQHHAELPAASDLLRTALGDVGSVRLRNVGLVMYRPAAPRTRLRRRDSNDGGTWRQDDRRRAGVVAVSGIRTDGSGRIYAGVQPADDAATLVLPRAGKSDCTRQLDGIGHTADFFLATT